jgi:hypothetical protein
MVLGSTAYTQVCGVRFRSTLGSKQGGGEVSSGSSHKEGDGAGCLRDPSALVSLCGMLLEELGSLGVNRAGVRSGISQHGGPVGGEGRQGIWHLWGCWIWGEVVKGTLALVPYGDGGSPCREASLLSGGGHVGGQGTYLCCMYSVGFRVWLGFGCACGGNEVVGVVR